MKQRTITRDVYVRKHFKIHKEEIQYRKTPIYHIESPNGVIKLGQIKWFPAWRGYCFFPEPDTIWDLTCLSEINIFLDLIKEGKI